MAVDPGNNNNNLSEEEKIREAIKKLIDELNDSLKEQGLSDRQREASVKIYKDLLEDAGTNATKLESIQKDLNIELNGSSGYARDFGNEVSLVVERLNEAIESITNQSDLSQRILSTFKKTRQVANSIADDADLSYVRSVKYMENQSDVLSVQEKRLKAQALEGAQALQLINTTSKAAEIARQMQHHQNELNAATAEGNVDKVKEIEQNIESLTQKKTILSLTDTALDKAREGKKLSEEEVESLKTYTTTTENLSELDKKRILSAIEFNNELVDGVSNFAALQGAINKSIEREDELNRRMGVTGAIMDGFSKIPGFSAIFKSEDVEHVKNLAREAYVEQKRFADLAANDKLAILEIEKEIKDLEKEKPEGYEAEIETLKTTRERHIASKKVNEEASRNVQLTTRSQIMGKLLTKSIGNLTDALTDPATIFTFLVTKGLQFNSEVTDISKNLGVTETQATKIRNEFTSISANTMDTAINSERLLQAQSDLNKELSLGVQFSGNTLVNFVRLTEKIGLSAQQAAKLTLASASTGESATEFAGKSALAAAQQAKTLGITVNMKEIMADTANLTNEQLILFGRQPEAIGKTLAEVKKLGIELGDLNAISGKLLNFQGSIESELEAELITGKQLNLERARSAALAGDQATLAKEIASQVGTISEFESMNVLQRQKMAEALGMNVDQLSGVLIRQEAINKGIAGAKDLTDEQLTAAKQLADKQGISMAEAVVKIQEQRSAQDKFNDAILKLQRLFGELLGGPVGELLDAIVDVASVIIGPIAAGLNFILTPVKMFTEFLTKVPDLLKVAAAAMLFLNFDSALSGFGKLKEKLISLPGLIPPIPPIIPGGGDIPGGGAIPPIVPGGSGPIPGAVTDQASNIVFDERMTGGGRFKDLDTGKMVSSKAANEAGVFKPFEEGKPSIPKPSDVTPDIGAPDLGPVKEGGEDIVKIPQSPDDGSMLKEKMKNIAEGLKYFASMEVVKGGIALLIASPGLYVLSKAADGLNKLGEVKGEALQEAMKGIAKGVEEFGTVKVILGSIGLIIASPGLLILSKASSGIKSLADIKGEVIKEALGGVAEGVKEFGSVQVLLGAIGLTVASPGLVLLGVASKGLSNLASIEGEVLESSMKSISEGISSFGTVNVILGSIGLLVASPGLVLLGVSSVGLKTLEKLKGESVQASMKGVADGVAEFSKGDTLLGSLGMMVASPGILAIALASPGLALIGATGNAAEMGLKGVARGIGAFGQNMVNIIKGSIALATLAIPIAAISASFKLLSGVDPGAMIAFSISLGILGGAAALLGNLLPQVLMGAIGLAAVGAAIIPAALAFNLLEGINLGAMFGFVGAISLLGGAAALLGSIAPLMLAGALGIAAVGVAIIPAALAFSLLEGLDPTAMIGFAGALGILGVATAALGMVGPMALLGALSLAAIGVAITPAANAFRQLEGLDPTTMLGFAASLGILGAAAAAFGLLTPAILAGSIGMAILGFAIRPATEAMKQLGGISAESMMGFAGALGILGGSVAALGLLTPLILAGSLAVTILGYAVRPAAEAMQGLAGISAEAMLGFAGAIGILGLAVSSMGLMIAPILLGSAALYVLGKAMVPAAEAMQNLAGISAESMIGFAASLVVLGGAVSLMGVLAPAILLGSGAVFVLGKAIVPAAEAMKNLAGISGEAIASFAFGLSILGKSSMLFGALSPLIILGAGALAVLGVALEPATEAMKNLAGIDSGSMLGFAASLTILGTASILFGTVAPLVLAGAGALAVLGRAIKPAIESFKLLEGLDPSVMMGFAGALSALGLAAVGFGLMSPLIILGAGGIALLGFALRPLAKIAPKLDLTSTALKGIATSVALLATSLNTLDAAKLETLSDFKGNINISSVSTPTTDQSTTATNTVDQASVATNTVTNTATNTVDQASVATNTATNTVDQASVATNTATTTQETLLANTENLAVMTSIAATELETFTSRINLLNISESTKQNDIDVKSKSLGIKPDVEVNKPSLKEKIKEKSKELVPGISVTTPPSPSVETSTSISRTEITPKGETTTTALQAEISTIIVDKVKTILEDGKTEFVVTVKNLATDETFTGVGSSINPRVAEGKAEFKATQAAARSGINSIEPAANKVSAPISNNNTDTQNTNTSTSLQQGITAEEVEGIVSSTIKALVPEMVASLNNIKVVNDNFNNSKQSEAPSRNRNVVNNNFA